jgi:hypothetical protein
MLSITIEEVFKVLEDEKTRKLITKMLAHRYRTDILSSYYKLDNIRQTISYHGERITPFNLAKNQIEFLRLHSDKPIDVVCQKYWDKMLPNKNYNHLQDHMAFEDQYSEISALVSDIVLVSPVFKLFANREHLEVVDVGSGKGNLGRMVVAINAINKCLLNDSSAYGHINKTIHNTDVFSNVNINFLNTDVYDWQDKNQVNQVEFRKQESAFDIPAPDSSQDIAITKWCFHHMTRSQMAAQTKKSIPRFKTRRNFYCD